MATKLFQKSLNKNLPKWMPEYFKIGPGGVLGRSWGHLGSKLEVLGFLAPNLKVLGRSWLQDGGLGLHLDSKMGAKIHENCCQERSKRLSFCSSFFGSTFEAIWCQLGSKLAPKAFPKWSQVGSKINPNWDVDL